MFESKPLQLGIPRQPPRKRNFLRKDEDFSCQAKSSLTLTNAHHYANENGYNMLLRAPNCAKFIMRNIPTIIISLSRQKLSQAPFLRFRVPLLAWQIIPHHLASSMCHLSDEPAKKFCGGRLRVKKSLHLIRIYVPRRRTAHNGNEDRKSRRWDFCRLRGTFCSLSRFISQALITGVVIIISLVNLA